MKCKIIYLSNYINSETCEKIERSIEELIAISPLSSEETAFASNTLKAIETCLQRKSKVNL